MKIIAEVIQKIKEYQKTGLKKEEPFNKFVFKPLKNEKSGFLMYSKETITETKTQNGKSLFEQYCKEYKTCKDYKTTETCNELNTYRYYYYCLINSDNKNPKQHATIIMMNPAFACSEKMDTTIDKIYKFLESRKFTSFDIVNLYPIRMPNSNRLHNFIIDLSLDNDNEYREFLYKMLEQELPQRIIIAAWGSKYHNRAIKIFKEKKSIKLNCFKKNPKSGSPSHFCVRGSINANANLEPYIFS